MALKKTFSGIYFHDNSWQVVPTDWICEENGVVNVWWPTEGNVTDLAKKRERVGKNWKPSIVREIAASSSKYTIYFRVIMYYIRLRHLITT